MKAVIDKDLCSGCHVCESLCPFSAIEMKKTSRGELDQVKAEVIEAMCQGCGACSPACPTGAIRIQQFGNRQVQVQVKAAFTKEKGGD